MELLKEYKKELENGNTYFQYAENEFKAKYGDREIHDYDNMVLDAVRELLVVFNRQGHSGMSQAFTRDIFNKLSGFEPLTEIDVTENGEWKDTIFLSNAKQHRRYGKIFKQNENIYPDITAIQWQGKEHFDCFIGHCCEISSHIDIRKDKIYPKKFVVHVTKNDYDENLHGHFYDKLDIFDKNNVNDSNKKSYYFYTIDNIEEVCDAVKYYGGSEEELEAIRNKYKTFLKSMSINSE